MKRLLLDHANTIEIAQGTHEGMTGKNNEDAYFFATYEPRQENGRPFYLAVVADGVGGQSAGEYASHLAVEAVETYFDQLPEISTVDILQHLETALKSANKVVHERSKSEPELHGMATTMVAIAILDGLLFSSHVGDSRIYLWRNQILHQLTVDHTWVQEAVDAGLLTAEQKQTHPNRNIIRRSLGGQETVNVDQTMPPTQEMVVWQGMPIAPGDLLLLCSDGLTDMISDRDIALTLDQTADLNETVRILIEKANAAGGRDNITVLLVRASASFEANPDSPFSPPDEIEASSPSALDSDTVRNIPRVVPVSMNEEQLRRDSRRRRLLLFLALIVLLVTIAAAYYLNFIVPNPSISP